jgi:hypothetical protein
VLSSQQSDNGIDGLLITFPGTATGVGLDFDTLRCVNNSCLPGEMVNFAFSSGETTARSSVSAPRIAFVGFTSVSPFSTLTITLPNGTPGRLNGVLNIDNFSFGPITPTAQIPEPATLTLLASALAGLIGWALRRGRLRAEA